MVVLACRDNHQEVKGFFFFWLKRVSWGFSPHLMHSGGTRHVVAMWLVLRGRFNAPFRVTLEFSAGFFFPVFCALFFKLPSFPLSSSFFTLLCCYYCSALFSPSYHSYCDFLWVSDFSLFLFFLCAFGFFRILPLFCRFLSSMLSSSEVRALCSSVSFLFARLGAFLGISRNFCPLVEDFVGGGNSLNLVLADLFLLLRQSVDWFKDLVSDRRAMLEVRSRELETGLSSSDGLVEEDTVISTLRVVRAFSTC